MRDIDYRAWSHRAADWSADYRDGVADRPVRAQVKPGDVAAQIADAAPELGEEMEAIFADFESIIPDGMTHWQHPRFFAYFTSNAAQAALVGDQLANAFASQCMLWQTSPAATELELKMVDWLRAALGLPDSFTGTFQDTASSATLCAVLTMRERALNFTGNKEGLSGKPNLRIYASGGTHSSIDKALWVAGLGQDNLVKITTGEGPLFPMDVAALERAIAEDRAAGHVPAGIVACVGGTSVGHTDNCAEICALAKRENLFVHVDAAWAASAMICPEFRHLWADVEQADSIVLNPHKWLGVPMECSLHLVRDPAMLRDTLSIEPEYLKTRTKAEPAKGEVGEITDLSSMSIQLGRRFRALKVWFLLRAHGLEDLRQRIRNHVEWAENLCERLRETDGFEIVTEPVLSLFSFRVEGDDERNLALVDAINDDGRIYLTQTKFEGRIAIRFVTGQFDMTRDDIDIAYDTITEIAAR
ncbi:pyridoxal-dependent decarboxylase [Ahrensia sp. R2A130]|uniref:pyridoxal phosphate-dependent decarboxylase family protein n=1 Tax=Ahrensia sp. R2A130 TaxID=744979 RepID=UPI0001E0B4BA|nr:pyridoxal-dependent decarboxylase [Ahrensia sp. R2A130]EFL89751.1 aromatic-L-amino-acid decarboxylase [Ahrensia sp. R2A130]